MIADKCGVFGITGTRNAADLTYLGLYALQHRGQESCGIAASDGKKINIRLGMGKVDEVFTSRYKLKELKGRMAIGHNRYSTTGASSWANIQPILINYKNGPLALGHNGNLTNYNKLRRKMEQSGSIFSSTSDTELILHLIAKSRRPRIEEALAQTLKKVTGAYSLVLLSGENLLAARDPAGVRPLALGKLRNSWVIASETCAFDILGAKYIRDIEPGEILLLNGKKPKSFKLLPKKQQAFCIFEYIYFSRPDSMIFGSNVDKVRRRLGRQLAREHPAEADMVISVPDSSNTAALGYAEAAGIPYEIGLIRNHYVGRTFIEPEQKIRDLDVKIKFNPIRGVLRNKRVVVVDDSIVRGTTSKKLVQMLKEAGAREVHLRITAPPIKFPCFYGINMPTKKELIASSRSVEAIKKYLEVDSLGYLSLEGLLSLPALPKAGFCHACFSGNYTIKLHDQKK
jgi:amidophosphoribosyltransferase